MRKIGIGALPQSIRPTRNGVFVSGKDKWLRRVNPEKSSVEWAVELPELCHELVCYDEKTLICCLRNGDVYLVQDYPEKVVKIGEGSGLMYSCGVNPKSCMMGGELYLVNHQSTKETKIDAWKIVTKCTG